jgi:DNA-binding NtrC family response regulator
MRLAQVLVYEGDGKLAESLRDLSRERGLRLRELRRDSACLTALRRGGPGILILKVGRDLEREMTILERVANLFPAAPVIVVSDTDYPGLAALAWDLGAYFVLFPPQPLEMLTDIVSHLAPPSPAEEQP